MKHESKQHIYRKLNLRMYLQKKREQREAVLLSSAIFKKVTWYSKMETSFKFFRIWDREYEIASFSKMKSTDYVFKTGI